MNVRAFLLTTLLLLAACRNAQNPTRDVRELPTTGSVVDAFAPTESASPASPTTAVIVAGVTSEPTAAQEVATPLPATTTPSDATPIPAPTESVEAPSPSVSVLPAPVYFIDAETRQIVRLAQDGLSKTVVTDEPFGVEEFAISADTLVYESNNDLIALDVATSNRRVLLTGDKMSDAVLLGEATFSPINSPSISPDGTQVAFALNGIQTLSLTDGTQPIMRLPNDPLPDFSNPDVEIPTAAQRQFYGVQWSPDGTQLAVEFGYFPEGGGVGVIDILDNTFTDLSLIARTNGAIGCCEFTWVASGQALLASDLVIYGTPGVATVDTIAKTVTPLITSTGDSDELPTLFRAPMRDATGQTLALVGELWTLDAPANYFQIARVNADASTALLYDGTFTPEQDVLWTPNGDGVLIGEGQTVFPTGINGGTRWVQLSGEEVTLPINGYNFAWSNRQIESLPAVDLDGLREVASADLQADPNQIAIRRILASDQLLYVAHTTDLRFDLNQPHMLGLYQFTANTWELVGLSPLGDNGLSADSPLGIGPDYLGSGSITQAFIEPSNVWLFVSGGVGAHGGVANLFRFDGQQVHAVANNSNGSPSAGWVEDLNGDGSQEVIFDLTDPYIFCYACGVRRVDFEVLRWRDGELVPAQLTMVEGNEQNNQAVTFAEADLWIDAASIAYQLLESEDATVRWNAYLIELISRHRLLAADSAYPLMSQMYAGDYMSAILPFNGLPPEVIFDLNGTLFAGTVADGWTDTMFPEIIETTTRAIAAKPQLAEAYFLRGWAKQFVNDGTALDDVTMAAELAPANPTFTAARDFLSPQP